MFVRLCGTRLWADDSNSTGDNPDGTSNLDFYTAAVTVVPAVPVLTSVGFGTNGYFALQLASTPMFNFGIDASTNLVNWTKIGSGVTGADGVLLFQDTNAVDNARMYRAHWPP